ncbi:MAG: hypothetical protein H6Q84_3747 [Deltaproteobacteria bacterium]|nr:hypothetical protein [Deltaproteobacteria bacterium]
MKADSGDSPSDRGRLRMRSRQISRSASAIFDIGRIFPASMMAMSRPAATASWRKTEFNTFREAGERPKETLLTPREVKTPGSSFLTRRNAARVFAAASESEASPEPIVKVRRSKTRSDGRSPCFPTARSWILFATASFSSTVIAIPFSWIVRAMTAAPYFRAMRQTRSRFFPPSSRFTELTRHLPGWTLSAASMPSGRVESTTIGAWTDFAKSRARAARSADSSLPA